MAKNLCLIWIPGYSLILENEEAETFARKSAVEKFQELEPITGIAPTVIN